MQTLTLERVGEFPIREIELPKAVGPQDVRVAIHTVGICGSDVY